MTLLFNAKGITETDRILIALTSLALNAPSTYTIAWSKNDPDKKQHYPILYAGIASSLATVLGAIFGHTTWGDSLMWGGLLSTFALFGYVVFVYNGKNGGNGHMLFINGNGEGAGKPVLIV